MRGLDAHFTDPCDADLTGSAFVPIAADNKLTANTISGAATGIDDTGTGTRISANVINP